MKIQLVYWVEENDRKLKKYLECNREDVMKIIESIKGLVDYEFEEIPQL